MKDIKVFLDVNDGPEWAVVITHFDSEDYVDPDWPEIVFCEDSESAELLKNTLNALSFRDFSNSLLSDRPFLNPAEVNDLWISLKAARYTVEPASDELKELHGHRYLPSIEVLKQLLPDLIAD